MTEKKNPESLSGLEANLEGLLGSLGQKLGEVFTRLEALDGAEITKDFKVGTAQARASGGVRMRGQRPAKSADKPTAAPVCEPVKDLILDLEITPDRIFITAEVPGVTLSDLAMQLSGAVFTIITPAATGSVTLPDDLRADDMSSALRNGILSIEIGRGA